MLNRLSVWFSSIKSEIRSRGLWPVIGSAIAFVVIETARHWFYGEMVEAAERIPRGIAFLRLPLLYIVRNPVGVTLIVFICVLGGLVIHAYFAGRETGLWLEFDPNQAYSTRPLRIQNSGKKTVFDVVVKIPGNGSDFVSDLIPRLVNDGSWVPCTSNGTVEAHQQTINRIVGMMLAGDLGEEAKLSIPVLISFRNGTQELEIRTPLLHGIKFSLPESHK